MDRPRTSPRTALLALAGLLAGALLAGAAGPTGAEVAAPAASRTDPPATQRADPPGDLRSVESFAGIADARARSLALFAEAGRVIAHPRCVNCHPATDRPLQGDAGRPHQPPVFATETGLGTASMPCASCHGQANFTLAGTRVGSMPGNPKWQLAPREMAWAGKGLPAICRQIKDTARNGGRDTAALIDHMAHDELVGWGWEPGAGRAPVPGTQAAFGRLVRAWVETGAECPD